MTSKESDVSILSGTPTKKPKLAVPDINVLITCVLCKGYLIDATTITECLHAFCKSCIIRHLRTSKNCPTCNVQVHKTKPLLNTRPDLTLQDIVYKLVPRLYKNEMKLRRDFYASHPHHSGAPSEERGEIENRIIYDVDEFFSISLEYYTAEIANHYMKKLHFNPEAISNRQNELNSTEFHGAKNQKIYFKCKASVPISTFKKLMREKFQLKNEKIEILYAGEAVCDMTLMDIAYIYGWHRNEPLRLFFHIEKPSKATKSAPVIQLKENIKPAPPKTLAADIPAEKLDHQTERAADCQQKEKPVANIVKPPTLVTTVAGSVKPPTLAKPAPIKAVEKATKVPEVKPGPSRTNQNVTQPKHNPSNRETGSSNHRSGSSAKQTATIAMMIKQQAKKNAASANNNNNNHAFAMPKANSNVNSAVSTSSNLVNIAPRLGVQAASAVPRNTNSLPTKNASPSNPRQVSGNGKTSNKVSKSNFQVVERRSSKGVNASGQPVVQPLKILRVPDGKRSAPPTFTTEETPNKIRKVTTDSKTYSAKSPSKIKDITITSVPISSKTDLAKPTACATVQPERVNNNEVPKSVDPPASIEVSVNGTVKNDKDKCVSKSAPLTANSVTVTKSDATTTATPTSSPLEVTVLQNGSGEKSCLESPSSLVIISSPEEPSLPATSSAALSPLASGSSATKKDKTKEKSRKLKSIDEVAKSLAIVKESKNNCAAQPNSSVTNSTNDQPGANKTSTPTVKRGPLDLSRKYSNLPVIPAPSRPTMKPNSNKPLMNASVNPSERLDKLKEKKHQSYEKTVNNNLISSPKMSVTISNGMRSPTALNNNNTISISKIPATTKPTTNLSNSTVTSKSAMSSLNGSSMKSPPTNISLHKSTISPKNPITNSNGSVKSATTLTKVQQNGRSPKTIKTRPPQSPINGRNNNQSFIDMRALPLPFASMQYVPQFPAAYGADMGMYPPLTYDMGRELYFGNIPSNISREAMSRGGRRGRHV